MHDEAEAKQRYAEQYHEQSRQQLVGAMAARRPQDQYSASLGSGPRLQPAPPGPGSPVETALYAIAELTGQVERLVDELYGRLSRGGVVQDVPVNTAPPSELPKPSCALMGQLLEHAGHLERLSLQLQTLLQQLAL
jgi:hypothetical protein